MLPNPPGETSAPILYHDVTSAGFEGILLVQHQSYLAKRSTFYIEKIALCSYSK